MRSIAETAHGPQAGCRGRRGASQAAVFTLAGGKTVHYGKLAAHDAAERVLTIRLVAAPGGIALEVDDERAAYPIRVDPLLATTTYLYGTAQADAAFGTCVDAAGDVDGDGYGDVLVGAPSHDGTFVNGGKAYLFRGQPGGLATSPDWTAQGASTNTAFGCPALGAGVVNNDHFADVMIGAPLHDSGQLDEGVVSVFHGGLSGLQATPATVLERNVAGGQFGKLLVAAGDVNRDGYGDIFAYTQSSREITLHRGSSSGIVALPQFVHVVVPAQADPTISAGDFNGDGFSDLAYTTSSSSWAGPPTEPAATMTVAHAFGSSAGMLPVNVTTSPRMSGVALAMGDYNGDGNADLVFSGINLALVGVGGNAVWCGSATGFTTCVTSSTTTNQSVTPAEDINGDGFADILTYSSTGFSVMYGGQPQLDLSGQFYAVSPGPISAAPAGDVDGDGHADLIAGAPGYDGTQANQGRVQLFRGSADGLGTKMIRRWS